MQEEHVERVSIAQELMAGIIDEYSRKFFEPKRVMLEEQTALEEIAQKAKDLGPGPIPADPMLRVNYVSVLFPPKFT